jgi:ferredoxin
VSIRVDPELRREVAEFGGEDVNACFNCGNCTAVCPLSRDGTVFPRKIIRYLQLGMKDKLLTSPEPWLCYYCGECSETCPRQANPGETMMAVRRYLTSLYDWTGLSKRLYMSQAWEFAMLFVVALIVVGLFYFLHGPMVADHVELNTFAPAEWIEVGDLALALILAVLLLSNAYRMFRAVMSGDEGLKIPLSLYVKELTTLIAHGATQMRWRECAEASTRWIKHLLLVSAYATMFLLVVVFIRWFQTDQIHPIWHPTRLLGYYATAVLLYVTADMMIGRLRKRDEIHKHSHPTDWMFLILLFLTSLTGILVHAFRIGGLPLPTYYMYVVHLAIAVPMLVIEVPFGKWAHLAYRPLVIYLLRVKERARAAQSAVPSQA